MALLGSSNNEIKVNVVSKGDPSAINKTAQAVDGLSNSASNASRSSDLLSGVATKGKLALVALGVAAGAAGTASVKSAADFEQTRIGLENMLGSADAARAMLRQISDFAAETPFEFPELANATRQLVAFGFEGQDAFDTMKQLGDVSAAIGAPIGDLAYLMGTLRTQGRAFTVDIRQFAQRGIPIYEYLAKTLNKTTAEINEMVEAGEIGFPEVEKAFQAMTGEGGKFYNTMEKQSKSLGGQWSTLTDNLGMLGKQLVGINKEGDVRDGSFMAVLRDGMLEANAALGDLNNSFDDTAPKLSRYGELAQEMGVQTRESFNVIDHLKMAIEDTGRMAEIAQGRVTESTAQLNIRRSEAAVINQQLRQAEDELRLAHDMFGENSPQYEAALANLKQKTDDYYGALINQTGAVLDNNIAIGNLKTAVELQTGAQEGLASAVSIATSNWDANLKIVGSVGPAHQQQVAGVLELKSAVSEVVVTWKDAYSLIQTQSIQLNQRLQYTTNDIMGMYQKVTNQANDTAIKIQGANAQIQGGAANLQGGAVQKRATGGPVSSGRSYVVGEMEQEVFVPNSSGTVYNQQQMRNMGAGSSPNGGGGVTIQTLIIQPQTYEAGMGVFKALDNDSLLASKNLTTNGGGIR